MRQLAPLGEGRTLREVEILDPRWSRPLAPAQRAAALTGRRVKRLGRRGKYLLWTLAGDVYLAQHLRMTGSVLADPDPEPAHTRVRILLSRGRRLAIVDPRRFGTGELLLGSDAMESFFAARLGLEPFDERFTAEHLRTLARGSTAPIKALLLDQRKVAGVGDIYADAALVRAGIHPRRPAGAPQPGPDARGAPIDDFRHVDGVRGSFQDPFLVSGRAGEPCARCGAPVVKMGVGGRGRD